MNKERKGSSEPLTLETIVEIARDTLLRDGSHPPTIVIEGTRGMRAGVFEEMKRTQAERETQMFEAGLSFGERENLGGLQQVFFITEAWMSTVTKGKLPDLPPSKDPQRREILIITHVDARGPQAKAKAALLEILRDEAGEVRELTPGEEWEGADVKSPLLGAFVLGYVTGSHG